MDWVGRQILRDIFHKYLVCWKKIEILNFEQGDSQSLYDSWERFKLLLKRCPNYNMNKMEQMQHFIRGLKFQIWIILDVSIVGIVRIKNEDEVREVIERMCLNEYHS